MYNVFLLPLDVANQDGSFEASGGIPMEQIEVAFYFATVCLAIVVVPFTMFYYEGYEDKDDGEIEKCARYLRFMRNVY